MKSEQCLHCTAGTPSKCPKTKKINVDKVDGPDGASAWCVAFSAFLINFIMAGLSRMSGVLYVAFIDMFHTDRKGASMPFSVRSSTMNLLGPVVGILGQKYGVRIVSIIGGFLGTASAALCFFVDDIVWITVIWGGLNGVGTALVTTLTTVVIAQYFDEYMTTASGMSFSGACIGSFIFPPLIENLLQVYGLEGSFLIVAGIIMHCIPAAMILRKPSWIKIANRNKIRDVESTRGVNSDAIKVNNTVEKVTSGVDLDCLRTNGELVLKLLTTDISKEKNNEHVDTVHPPKEEILREMEDVYAFVGKTPVSLRYYEVPPKMRVKFECETSPVTSRGRSFRTSREPYLSVPNSPVSRVHTPLSPRTKPTQCKPFILSKLMELYDKNESQIVSSVGDQKRNLAMKVLKELRKLHKVYEAVKRRNIFANVKSDIKTTKVTPKVLIPKSDKDSVSNGLWDSIKNSMKLHTNPLFLLISLCRAVHFTTFIPAITIFVDYTMDKGLTEEDGIYIIAALSVGDLLGRLFLGWVTDRGFVSMPKYMLIVMIIQGICTALLPLMNTMATLLPAVAIYAMLQGSVFVRHSVLVSKYMKIDEQPIAMGCINFFAGLLGFAVPSYVGFFRDTIGSYDGIFYVNGAIGAAIGLVWVFEPYFAKLSSNDTQETSQSSEEKV